MFALKVDSLIEEDEGLHQPNCQTNLVIVLLSLSLLVWYLINITAYHLGRYETSSPSSIELHALTDLFLLTPSLPLKWLLLG